MPVESTPDLAGASLDRAHGPTITSLCAATGRCDGSVIVLSTDGGNGNRRPTAVLLGRLAALILVIMISEPCSRTEQTWPWSRAPPKGLYPNPLTRSNGNYCTGTFVEPVSAGNAENRELPTHQRAPVARSVADVVMGC